MLGIGLSLTSLLRSSVAGFSPASLFTASEPGIWLDPSDLTTMFQDTAGTTPVTTPGQTVALALDKSKGLVLGSELRGTGTTGLSGTATAATYNTGTGVGTASRVDSGNQSYVSFGSTVANNFYLFSIQNTGASNLVIRINNSGGTVLQVVNAGASFAGYVTGGTALVVTAQNNGTTASFTVISVKELPGFHATQSILASRPTYSIVPRTGRRNLLTRTEEFNDAAWTKTAVTVSANVAVAPDGTTTAEKVTVDTANSFHRLTAPTQNLSATSHTLSVYMKAAEYTSGGLSLFDGSVFTGRATFDLSAGTVAITNGSATITSVGNGWYRCTVTGNGSATTSAFISVNSVFTFTGDGTSGILIWGAQLETGSSATAYQRVGSAFDVTEAGVASLSYLSFDGVDDFLVTPTITPGVDKVQVFAGVRKLSDAAIGMLVETSTSPFLTNGAFGMYAPVTTSGANYAIISRGTSPAQATSAGSFAAPTTNTLTGISDISGDLATLRVNGTQAATSSADQGTGNYLAYPLYIGRRAGTTVPFNGQLYSLIVRFGANLDANTITNTETWVNGKTGAY